MELRIIGCTGSMSGPESSASCYLVRARGFDTQQGQERWWNIALDLGPGSFGRLWRHIKPFDLDAVFFSHCHADHIADIISLHVYKRWGPGVQFPPILVIGPQQTRHRIRQIDGCDDTETYEGEFSFIEASEGVPISVGPLTLTPYAGWHSVPSYGVRIEGPHATDVARRVSLFYTGDTDECESIIRGAQGADLLLSEVGFTSSDTTRGIHMDGARVGRVATQTQPGQLVLTHIQPWVEVAQVLGELRSTWSGPVSVAQEDRIFQVGGISS
ncbi:MBL fold metallo-hydrolase [Schaalia sp. lx-100]|uniref:MBL fold metallo-hydrolase n=1 Tax=Schaalia sp. lx-100 TaxID=2899081 RepID=UPI001E2EFFEC|nr:MBL fold metallo-hydrolase [Schaalia sp. lx-100]MCD4558101.1 MBL fold metallo-hydrolase [Schaalia sp. lx-100]